MTPREVQYWAVRSSNWWRNMQHGKRDTTAFLVSAQDGNAKTNPTNIMINKVGGDTEKLSSLAY